MEISTVNMTRIYADGDGESRFEDVAVPCSKQGLGFISNPMDVEALYLRETPGGESQDWHVAPRKQYVVLLSGTVEVQVSTGEVRQFGTGDVLLAEDTSGKGHRTPTLSSGNRKSLFITLREAA